MHHMEILQCYTTLSSCKIYSWHQSYSFFFFLYTATQLVCSFQMIYYHCSISSFPKAHTYKFRHHRRTFSPFLYCFSSALLNIIMHLDDTEVLHRNYDCTVSGGTNVLCVDWDKLQKKKGFKKKTLISQAGEMHGQKDPIGFLNQEAASFAFN